MIAALREEIRNIDSSAKRLRSFGILIAIVLGILAAFLAARQGPAAPIFLVLAALAFAAALLCPGLLKIFHKVWMSFAVVLGFFMTRVILSLLFYFVFTPLGFCMRLFGHKFLDLQWNPDQDSFWIAKDASQQDRSDLERQF